MLCIFTDGAIGGGVDFDSDPLIAVFTPGASQASVALNITKDELLEPTEMLKFNLTVPDEFSDVNGRLLVMTSDGDMANGEIINSGGMQMLEISIFTDILLLLIVLVNFTASSFDVDDNETEAIIRLAAFGEFDTDFSVTVIATPQNDQEQSKYVS